MPEVTLKQLRSHLPARVRAKGKKRGRVGILTGCVQSVFFPQVNAATARVLSAEGFEVIIPPAQGCCGALAIHGGRDEEAKRYARALIDTFEREGMDHIIVNAAGCGSTMKEYAHLLRDDPAYSERANFFSGKVLDATEFLAEQEYRTPRRLLNARVAYHDACHLAHAQGIRRQPRDLLSSIPGIELVPIPESDICCGSAGIYNLVKPEPAAELGERKARNILSTGADLVASANPGCTLQIQAAARKLGRPIKILHPIEIIDRSLRVNRRAK